MTIAHVAKACGVSITTVSQALRPAGEAVRVSAATRQKVLEVARQLNYHPNWLGRALRGCRTRTIGVLFDTLLPPMRGIYEVMMRELNRELMANAYCMLYAPIGDEEGLWRSIVLERRVDGVVVSTPPAGEVGQLLLQQSLPAVLLNQVSTLALPQLQCDESSGMRLALDHLTSLGHRRIAYVEFDLGLKHHRHYSISARKAAYIQQMREHGLEALTQVMHLNPDTIGPQLLQRAHRPTAVIAYRHDEAIAVLHHAYRHGLRIPHDLSLITYNNVFPVDHLYPPLTAIDIPSADMGRHAAQLLLNAIDHPTADQPSPRASVFAQTLVVRESTACPTS